jgi:hypothetical protein
VLLPIAAPAAPPKTAPPMVARSTLPVLAQALASGASGASAAMKTVREK